MRCLASLLAEGSGIVHLGNIANFGDATICGLDGTMNKLVYAKRHYQRL